MPQLEMLMARFEQWADTAADRVPCRHTLQLMTARQCIQQALNELQTSAAGEVPQRPSGPLAQAIVL